MCERTALRMVCRELRWCEGAPVSVASTQPACRERMWAAGTAAAAAAAGRFALQHVLPPVRSRAEPRAHPLRRSRPPLPKEGWWRCRAQRHMKFWAGSTKRPPGWSAAPELRVHGEQGRDQLARVPPRATPPSPSPAAHPARRPASSASCTVMQEARLLCCLPAESCCSV